MKRCCIVIIFLLPSLSSVAQKGLLLGASVGGNFSGVRGGRNYFDAETKPQPGWSASAVLAYKPIERLWATLQLGGMTEANATKGAATYEFRYAWADGTMLISYLPISRKGFDLFAGSGFSARRIIDATSGGYVTFPDNSTTTIPTRSMLDRVYTWSYLLPFTIGTNLKLPSSANILISAEYHLGLKERFRPIMASYPGVDYTLFESNEKPYSICLKVGFVFPLSAQE